MIVMEDIASSVTRSKFNDIVQLTMVLQLSLCTKTTYIIEVRSKQEMIEKHKLII
jgi:hypothetical protein